MLRGIPPLCGPAAIILFELLPGVPGTIIGLALFPGRLAATALFPGRLAARARVLGFDPLLNPSPLSLTINVVVSEFMHTVGLTIVSLPPLNGAFRLAPFLSALRTVEFAELLCIVIPVSTPIPMALHSARVAIVPTTTD